MEITLEEAFAGKTAEVRSPDHGHLRGLLGLRRQGRHAAEDLPDLRRPRPGARTPRASSRIERTCPTCQGRGQVIDDPCASCRGAGRVTRERTLSVNIPAGVEDGTRIRLAGEGEAGVRGGPPGDLYIFLSIEPHEFFQRDGADLHCRVPISMVTAALGGEFEVPTIDGGKTKVKVPEGTQTGTPLPPQGQGHAGAALEADRRHVRAGRGRDAAEPDASGRRSCWRSSRSVVRETHPESTGFFARVKDFFDTLGSRAGSA